MMMTRCDDNLDVQTAENTTLAEIKMPQFNLLRAQVAGGCHLFLVEGMRRTSSATTNPADLPTSLM